MESLDQNGSVGRTGAFPDGTVTFLLTDVEGSTGLWADRPDEMAIAVPRHYEILGGAITAHDGVRPVEQGEGDSVVGVFTSAVDGIRAAAAAQTALAEELPWLRVRMAVHTGEALVLDDGAYGGTSIIRCARLRACGHGGQVLVSDTTAALVADDLEVGIGLVDLGVAQLRDLARPERVWQLELAGRDSAFPPLRSLAAPPHNVPTALSSLVGRNRELTEIAALLDTNRLVTLAGSGGVGKTRLAQQAAADALERNPGGTWWIELASITTSAQAGERLAAAIGVGSSSPSEVTDLIARHLRDAGSTLVVMDNAEHLVDAVADLAKHLLAECRDLRVLVTSREPLGIGGELVWRVPSLASPPSGLTDPARLLEHDAAELFVERARQARPNLTLDATATAAIASICTRLDGIPLAIELAAARARNIPLDRLAAGLDDAFRLLTGGDRTATARQQTLLASIAWSVDLLDEADDAVFRRLAVFADAFTLEAVEVVTTDDRLVDRYDVLDVLGRLVDKSLVQFDDHTDRYRLLETVRQFGLDRLRHRGELADTRARHAYWCVEWAEVDPMQRLGTDPAELMAMVPDLVAALDWTTTEHPDLAVRICAGLRPLLALLGPSTCHALADWLMQLDRTTVTPEHWAAGVSAVAGRGFFLGRLELAELIPAALEAADPADTATTIYLRFIPMGLEMMSGKFAGAFEMHDEILAAQDEWGLSRMTGSIGLFAALFGRLDLARRYLAMADEVLARRSLPSTPDAAGYGHGGNLCLALLEGRLHDARTLAIWADPIPSEYAYPSVAWSVHVGVVTADPALVRRPAQWIDRFEPQGLHQLSVTYVRCMLALSDDTGDGELVGECAERLWLEIQKFKALHGGAAEVALVGFLAADRPDDVGAIVEVWTAVVAEAEGPQPLNEVILGKARALLARHEGRDADAIDAAHSQLDHAYRSGLVLHTIDALIHLAELAERRSDDVHAARLAGAATAERDHIGYRAPLIGHVIDVDGLNERLAAERPDAYAEGTRLDLDAAVELASRMRGERGRPTTGWESLTPTERLVAEHAATGATNAQIAEQLLISVPTVKTHLTRIFTKLGITNRTQLAIAASQPQLEGGP